MNFVSIIHSSFDDDTTRRMLRKSWIIEFLTVTIINFLSSEWQTAIEVSAKLKMLIFYVWYK